MLVLEEPRTFAVEAGDDELTGHTTMPFRVEWWLSTDGDDIPLESQSVEALPVSVRIEREGGGLRLELQLRQDTTVFALDGALDVESIDVTVTGHAPRVTAVLCQLSRLAAHRASIELESPRGLCVVPRCVVQNPRQIPRFDARHRCARLRHVVRKGNPRRARMRGGR